MRRGFAPAQPVTQWLSDDESMLLLESFCYTDPEGCEWWALPHDVVNGASIPRFFWRVVGAPLTGRYRRASIPHDTACVSRTRAWERVHWMFYYACRDCGLSRTAAFTLWFAVWWGGPRWNKLGTLYPWWYRLFDWKWCYVTCAALLPFVLLGAFLCS